MFYYGPGYFAFVVFVISFMQIFKAHANYDGVFREKVLHVSAFTTLQQKAGVIDKDTGLSAWCYVMSPSSDYMFYVISYSDYLII